MSDIPDQIKVRDIDGRISQCFDIDCFCLWRNRLFDFFRMIRIHEMCRNSELRQCIGKELIGAAVKGGCGNDFITGSCNIQNGIRNCCCAACYGKACCAAFKGSQSLFQYILRRIGQAAVNVTRLAECEAVFCFLCILEYIGCRLIDRNGSCPCYRIFCPAVAAASAVMGKIAAPEELGL